MRVPLQVVKTLLLIAVLMVAGCAGYSTAPIPAPTKVAQAMPTPENSLRLVEGLAGPVPANTPAIVDLYSRNFDKLLFETEFNGSDPWVRKWTHPIRYRLSGETPQQKKIVAQVTRLLTEITGVQIGTKQTEARGYIVKINLTSANSGEGKSCMALFNPFAPDGSPVSARIIIGGSFTGKNFEPCLMEELSQVLGPMNDTILVKDSLWRPYSEIGFLNDHTYDRLTWHDAIILRTLYDFRIKPGMHRDQALPIARTIIAELLEELNS